GAGPDRGCFVGPVLHPLGHRLRHRRSAGAPRGGVAMSAVPMAGAAPARRRANASFWHAAWYRYRRNRLALVAGVIAVLILLVGILAPYISPYDEASIDLSAAMAGASWHHWLGTDQIGRDTL